MSSILDALNKLEQEKAQARRSLDDAGDPVNAAHDLVGRSVLRDRVTVRVSPVTLLVSGGAVFIALVSVAIALAIMVFSPSAPDQLASVSAPISAPASVPAAEVTVAEVSPPPAPESRAAESPAPEPPAAVPVETPPAAQGLPPEVARLRDAAPTPMPDQIQSAPPKLAATAPPVTTQSAPTQSPPPSPAASIEPPKSATTEPAPPQVSAPGPAVAARGPSAIEPPAETSPAPERVARSSEPIASRPSRSLPAAEAPPTRAPLSDDISTLPILTPADFARYGLVQLKINLPTPSGPRNPQGSAVLTVREEAADGTVVTNTMKFYENQRIQTTSLRLFKVEQNGVGIEDMRSGQRYRLPF